jgi:hypothetical protein
MKQAESFFPFAGGPPKTEAKSDEKAKTEAKGDKPKVEPPAGEPPAPAKQRSASSTPRVNPVGYDMAIVAAFLGYWSYYWIRT